jgi:hypothetical protein
MVIAPSRFGYLVGSHRDYDVTVFFKYNNDVSAVWNEAKYTVSATALADCPPIMVLKNVIDLISRQAMFFHMRHVSTGRGIPENLRPSHSNDALRVYDILLQ